LSWRAELHAANLECSNASADFDTAMFTASATKAGLTAAIAADNAANTQEFNAKAHFSTALKWQQDA